ncbi:hypothetical protein [Sneathiella limimaris]|uniref:hypothetical protein n=1 Tax=Sneathiella limimaris TaxID=1964213 RepID=UPI00146E5DD8|nr:hypothetical protein [Sneathiella limimaris]
MLGYSQQITKERTANKNTTIVFVALYFLLLAFFIYLTSISEPAEERIRSVIGSIDVTFKGKEKVQSEAQSTEFKSKDLGTATFHAELKQVYETAIPLVQSEINKQGDILQFRIPVSQIFPDGTSSVRDTREQLITRTASLLIKRSGIVPTDMEILMDVGNDLPAAAEMRGNLTVKRIDSLVTLLLDAGVPARNFFVGLTNANTDEIVFRFYIRENFNNQFRNEEGAN